MAFRTQPVRSVPTAMETRTLYCWIVVNARASWILFTMLTQFGLTISTTPKWGMPLTSRTIAEHRISTDNDTSYGFADDLVSMLLGYVAPLYYFNQAGVLNNWACLSILMLTRWPEEEDGFFRPLVELFVRTVAPVLSIFYLNPLRVLYYPSRSPI